MRKEIKNRKKETERGGRGEIETIEKRRRKQKTVHGQEFVKDY